ncbi:Protein CLASP-1 [Frankliniella fusca]|uniref:Protein CLASP-1 n=1 Tax=Frankliniella fusca TaxID=407009 RepID=A0AAE1LIR3_9NEOP|nr:Protein CLASP-1 [Frankliniella fusca]
MVMAATREDALGWRRGGGAEGRVRRARWRRGGGRGVGERGVVFGRRLGTRRSAWRRFRMPRVASVFAASERIKESVCFRYTISAGSAPKRCREWARLGTFALRGERAGGAQDAQQEKKNTKHINTNNYTFTC